MYLKDKFSQEFTSRDRFRFSRNLGENWQAVFGRSPWAALADDRVFLAVRVVLAVLMTGILFWDVTVEARAGALGYFFVYLTNWTLLAVTGYTVLAALAAGAALSSRGTYPSATATGEEDAVAAARAEAARAGAGGVPRYVRAAWLLHSVAFPAALLVVVLFWTLVYVPGSTPVKPLTVSVHGVNLLVMLVDCAVAQQPYFLAHGLYMWLYGAAYTLFSALYYLAGGTDAKGNPYIYAALDWRNPQKTGLLAAGTLLVAIPAAVLLCWPLVVARDPSGR